MKKLALERQLVEAQTHTQTTACVVGSAVQSIACVRLHVLMLCWFCLSICVCASVSVRPRLLGLIDLMRILAASPVSAPTDRAQQLPLLPLPAGLVCPLLCGCDASGSCGETLLRSCARASAQSGGDHLPHSFCVAVFSTASVTPPWPRVPSPRTVPATPTSPPAHPLSHSSASPAAHSLSRPGPMRISPCRPRPCRAKADPAQQQQPRLS